VWRAVRECGRRVRSGGGLGAWPPRPPPRLHVVRSSRLKPPFPVQRLRGRGEVLDIDAAALAFREDEIAELLKTALDEEAPALASTLHELTRGWPAAVRLALEALRTVPPAARGAGLAGPQGPGRPR